MTCWTESGTQSSHIKGLDKCVWCWVCSVLSKQRGEVVWWGGGVRFTKANRGQESQWPYTDCGPAVTGMFASWTYRNRVFCQSWGDWPIIFTRDCVTREKYTRITHSGSKTYLFTTSHILFFISMRGLMLIHVSKRYLCSLIDNTDQ